MPNPPRDTPESRKNREPEALADVLGGVLAAIDLDLAAPAAAIGQHWEAIVGPEVAEHCRPTGVKAGVLHAEVDSSVWCQQLHLRSPEILSALKEFLGSAAPTDLRFRVGYSRKPKSQTQVANPSRKPKSQTQVANPSRKPIPGASESGATE